MPAMAQVLKTKDLSKLIRFLSLAYPATTLLVYQEPFALTS